MTEIRNMIHAKGTSHTPAMFTGPEHEVQLLQSLAASRRELPMVKVSNPDQFKFDTPDGEKSMFTGPEHEVVNYQLLAVVKEVCQTLFSIRGIEFAGVWDVPFAWIIFLISVIYGAVTPRLWLSRLRR
jgi:hypothetical protein